MLFGKMLADWARIAGEEVAFFATPVEMKFARTKDKKPGQAVLHLAVSPAFALEFSYQIPLLIERLNVFFGYPAIKDIKIIQNKIMNNKQRKTLEIRPLTPAETRDIDTAVAGIQENDLQEALKNLGQSIASRTK
jgi:hypothetical protein